MKTFITKYWTLFGFILAFVLENYFKIMSELGFSEFWIEFTKGIGTIVYGYYFTSNFNAKQVKTASENEPEGDGAVKPSKGF